MLNVKDVNAHVYTSFLFKIDILIQKEYRLHTYLHTFHYIMASVNTLKFPKGEFCRDAIWVPPKIKTFSEQFLKEQFLSRCEENVKKNLKNIFHL